jgi:hypothetical protein
MGMFSPLCAYRRIRTLSPGFSTAMGLAADAMGWGQPRSSTPFLSTVDAVWHGDRAVLAEVNGSGPLLIAPPRASLRVTLQAERPFPQPSRCSRAARTRGPHRGRGLATVVATRRAARCGGRCARSGRGRRRAIVAPRAIRACRPRQGAAEAPLEMPLDLQRADRRTLTHPQHSASL